MQWIDTSLFKPNIPQHLDDLSEFKSNLYWTLNRYYIKINFIECSDYVVASGHANEVRGRCQCYHSYIITKLSEPEMAGNDIHYRESVWTGQPFFIQNTVFNVYSNTLKLHCLNYHGRKFEATYLDLLFKKNEKISSKKGGLK